MSAKVKYFRLIDAPRKGQKQASHSAEFLRSFVQETLNLVEEGLRRDGMVRIHEFGTFQLKWVNERKGRNPQTGEPLVIPGQYRVVFRPASKVENRLNRRYSHLKPEIIETVAALSQTPKLRPVRPEIPAASAPTQPPQRAAIPIFIQPPYPPRNNRMRFDFAEEEEGAYEEIEVGELEEVFRPSALATEPETSRQQNKSRRVQWYAGSIFLLLALLLVFATPIFEHKTIPPAAEIVQKTEVRLNPANGHTKPANGLAAQQQKPPVFAGGKHEVAAGDNLWRLSDHYYLDPFLWPNIYRVNTAVIADPDVLEPQEILDLPVLYGPPDQLTETDRRNLAEGYFLVFDYYRQTRKHLAPFALWAAVRYDPKILDTHSDDISPTDIAFLKAHEVDAVASR